MAGQDGRWPLPEPWGESCRTLCWPGWERVWISPLTQVCRTGAVACRQRMRSGAGRVRGRGKWKGEREEEEFPACVFAVPQRHFSGSNCLNAARGLNPAHRRSHLCGLVLSYSSLLLPSLPLYPGSGSSLMLSSLPVCPPPPHLQRPPSISMSPLPKSIRFPLP